MTDVALVKLAAPIAPPDQRGTIRVSGQQEGDGMGRIVGRGTVVRRL